MACTFLSTEAMLWPFARLLCGLLPYKVSCVLCGKLVVKAMMWVFNEYSAYSAQLCVLEVEILEITDARMWYFKWYGCLSSLNCDNVPTEISDPHKQSSTPLLTVGPSRCSSNLNKPVITMAPQTPFQSN